MKSDKTIIEINNLQDFILNIEKLKGKYYFRGESSTTYDEIVASAFREYQIPFSNEKKRIDYRVSLNEYYSEIGHQLTEIERDNFLQFAQHHGLPTPLIDITSNPLVALYFACSSNYSENTCKVHIFDKTDFIDMSLFDNKENMTMNDFFFDNDFTYQLFSKIKNLSQKAKNKLLFKCLENLKPIVKDGLVGYEQKYIGIDADATFAQVLREFLINEYEDDESYVEKFIEIFLTYFSVDFKNNPKRNKFRTKISVTGKDSIFEIHYDNYHNDNLATIILFAISRQCNLMTNQFVRLYGQSYEIKSHVIFPLISVQPSVKFERMKTQEGIFIYQIPHYLGKSDNFIGFSKIESDIEFLITDKKKIFKSLEKIGINQKTIFPDYDNIAEYLKNKQLLGY